MATGQTLLALASIVLLSIITMSIRQMYVQSVNTTVESQEMADALNFGRDIADELQSFAYRYDDLNERFGDLNDVTNEDSRWEFESQIDKKYYATVDLSLEQPLKHGQTGRMATIIIYEEENGDYKMIAEYATAIAPL